MSERRTTIRRQRTARSGTARTATLAVVGVMMLAACGGTQAGIGSESVGVNDATATTGAGGGADDGGDDGTTITTAVAVEQNVGPDTTRQAYDGGGGEIVALIDDVLGPTEDVSAELGRLTPHPTFPTPTGGAYIVGLVVTAGTPTAEAESSGVAVEFLADAPADDLLTLYETSFVSDGWEPSERGEDEGKFGPTTELLLRRDDDPFHAVKVSVTKPELFQANLVKINYSGFGEGLPEQVANELGDWTAEWVPEGGELNKVRIDIRPTISSDGLETSYSISGDWLYDGQADLAAQIQTTAAGSGHAHETTDQGVRYEEGPLPGSLTINEDFSNSEELDIFVFYENAMAPSATSFGSGQNQASDGGGDSTEVAAAGDVVLATASGPLPTLASRDQIRPAAIDALGPTDDVSTAMATFGSFPELPTPDNAEVVRFSANVVPTFLSDEFQAEQNWVVLRVGGATLDELIDYYESSLIGAGWVETSRNDRDNGSSTTSERTYTINGVEAGRNNDPLQIKFEDWNDEPEVTITWLQILPIAEVDLNRWLGWQDDLPLPPGGNPVNAGISVLDNGQRLKIDHNVTYRFAEDFDDEFERELIDELGPASGYDASPFRSDAATGANLSSPYFDEGSVLIGGKSLIFTLSHIVE